VDAIRHKDVQRTAKTQDRLARLARKVPRQAIVKMKMVAKQALGAAGLIRHS